MIGLRDIPWRLLVWMSERRKVGQLELCVVGSRAEADEVFSRAVAALDLIDHYDPALKQQIERDLTRLLFTEASGANYLAGIDACRIETGYTRRVPALELAMTIIHEATHACLAHEGRQYHGAERESIERACVEAEIRFATRVPGSDEAIEKVRQLLETRWWDAERITDDTIADLRERGVPMWLAKRLARKAAR